VLIGDLLAPLDELHDILAGYAASGVRGHLLQVLDPAEESLPFEGRVRFEGMEREGPLLIARVETVRDQYQARLAAHRDGLAAILARSHGWSLGLHRTDHPPHQALLALYGMMSGLPPSHAPSEGGLSHAGAGRLRFRRPLAAGGLRGAAGAVVADPGDAAGADGGTLSRRSGC
jgi:hypothetical protein